MRSDLKLCRCPQQCLLMNISVLSSQSCPEKTRNTVPCEPRLRGLYEKYPRVLGVFDTETAAELTEEECAALIKVMELRNKLTDMEMQSVYFRGCYEQRGVSEKGRDFITD